jgi:hypothetical protein
MEKKELRERFFNRFFYAEDGSRDWDRWRISDPTVVLEFILEEIDKAREEGRLESANEQLAEIELSRNEERKRTLEETLTIDELKFVRNYIATLVPREKDLTSDGWKMRGDILSKLSKLKQ